ncbi:MAG: hypothetical protein GWN84_20865 [Gammaproteobacteria bacterium]|nr:hypothetical protein [Gammaproteobacteria bacterium]NIR85213.1 hypothetical protein [Gammaproteobacteria bacterium]NIU06263.1 hypothetical protein [Gammaproteobacteria bacterium]NIX87536.1 hypothetical protein [Gammaproteobacteria bacterium]
MGTRVRDRVSGRLGTVEGFDDSVAGPRILVHPDDAAEGVSLSFPASRLEVAPELMGRRVRVRGTDFEGIVTATAKMPNEPSWVKIVRPGGGEMPEPTGADVRGAQQGFCEHLVDWQTGELPVGARPLQAVIAYEFAVEVVEQLPRGDAGADPSSGPRDPLVDVLGLFFSEVGAQRFEELLEQAAAADFEPPLPSRVIRRRLTTVAVAIDRERVRRGIEPAGMVESEGPPDDDPLVQLLALLARDMQEREWYGDNGLTTHAERFNEVKATVEAMVARLTDPLAEALPAFERDELTRARIWARAIDMRRAALAPLTAAEARELLRLLPEGRCRVELEAARQKLVQLAEASDG